MFDYTVADSTTRSRLRPAKAVRALGTLGILAVLGGCTVHPAGERAERMAAADAGKALQRRFEERPPPLLAEDASPDQLVEHALLTNAELEQRYWEWRAAIEQIPQDGTQATNLVLFGGATITRGRTSRDSSTVAIANDPMNDIVWPTRLSTAARRALENAQAAGLRFQKAKFDLRNKVLIAYYDYALNAELIRLEEANAQLLQTTVMVTEARNRAGAAGQQDLLKARNEVDLSRNEIANMRSQLPAQRATLNALLSRDPRQGLGIPTVLPASQPLNCTDGQLLTLAASRNPELAALAHELLGKEDGIQLARLQYYPDFSFSANTDLRGITQSLMGMITVPLLRYEAINAAIAQAEANLKASEAMRRQTNYDLKAQLVMDIVSLRDADRQLELFDHTVLPRTRQVVTIGRSAYETGQSTLLDFLDSERSLIAVQRLVANLRIARAKRLADLDAVVGQRLETQ